MFFDLPNDTNDINSNAHLVLDSSLLFILQNECSSMIEIDRKSLLLKLNQDNRFPDWAMAIRTGPLG